MKYIVTTILCLTFAIENWAQQNITLFQMQDVVHSASINPAVAPPCEVVIGLPVLGSISGSLNSPLAYNDLAGGDRSIQSDKFLSLLKNSNTASAKASFNILTVGIRTKQAYWQFSVNEKVSAHTNFSRDIFDVLLRGNGDYIGQTVEGKFHVNQLAYTEFALGYSRDLGHGIRLGIKPKILLGNMGIQSNNNTLSIYTDPQNYDVTLSSHIDTKAAIPGKVEVDKNGVVDNINMDNLGAGDILNGSNMGFGVDLGVVKDWDAGWRLSASLLDVGMIRWKNNTHRLFQDSRVLYEGAQIHGGIDNWNAFSDTLQSMINLHYDAGSSFTQWLSPIAILGASYPVLPRLRVGLTAMTEFRSHGSNPWAISATGFTENLGLVSLGLSYTITSNSMVNIGTVAAFHLGIVELFVASDNFLTFMRPYEQRNGNVTLGMQLRFGNKSYRSKQQEKLKAKLLEQNEPVDEAVNVDQAAQ